MTMVGPFGFDVSQFIPRGVSPAVTAALHGSQVASDSMSQLQDSTNALLDRKKALEQLAMDQATLRESARVADQMELGQMLRKRAEIAKEMELDRLTREAKQREIEGGLVGEAGAKFGVGDITGLEALKARAAIQAPQLQFQMPGRALTPLQPNGLADPFTPMAGLNITRGNETLYSGDSAEMRRRNQETARAGLVPLLSGAEGGSYKPFVESAVSMAGLGGISGAEAVKTGQEFGGKAAGRDAAREAAMGVSMSRGGAEEDRRIGMERQRDMALHGQVEQIAQKFQSNVGLLQTQKDIANLGAVEQQINSGNPWSEKMANFQQMGSVIKGAMSDKDIQRVDGALGLLNKLEQDLNNFVSHGEITPFLREKMGEGIALLNRYNNLRVLRVGTEARNHVYASPGLMAQFRTPMEAAAYAMQAYHTVTQDAPTIEEIEQEAERIAPIFNQMKMHSAGAPPAALGGGSRQSVSVSARGGAVNQIDPGLVNELGGLGVAPLPNKPQPSPVQRAQELLRQMDGQNAGQ